MDVFILVMIYAVALAFSFGMTALLVKVICWAFGLTFMWRYALGIWAALSLLSSFLRARKE